jgi:putative nucleotidyltransferase with HDIG domain
MTAKRSRILIVDDEAGVRNLLFDVLSLAYECDRAANGAAAIQLAAQREYDIILCDIMMPDVSGIEVLKFVREHARATIVIMVTAVQDTRRAIEAIRLGAFDYILKPFDIEEIELVVHRGIEFKRVTEEHEVYQSRLETLVVERTSQLQHTNEELEASLLELSLTHRATMSTLASVIESRDAANSGHAERVTSYAVRLAKEIGLSGEELRAVETGSLLHDIGMIHIPNEVVQRPGGLDEAEWAEVRRHPLHGSELLRRIGFHNEAAPVVEQHHERWDGTGYPHGLKGEEIHPGARIFAVADCVDAMLTARPHSPARTLSEVADELRRCAGTQFDPNASSGF